jgi:hypothetical protein
MASRLVSDLIELKGAKSFDAIPFTLKHVEIEGRQSY